MTDNNAPENESTTVESTVDGQAPTVNLTKPKRTPANKAKPAVKRKPAKKKSRGESATSPRRIKAVEEKQLQALEYRKMAYTYAQIAEVLGYATAQGAYLAIQSALTRIIREPAEDVLKLELERLDAMFSKPYQAAIGGDLLAVGSCLNIMARKAKLLGLDAPAKVDTTVANKDGTPFKSLAVTDAQVADAVKKAADTF